MADNERERRLAVNESLLRYVNERIGGGVERFDIKGRTDFLCECARQDCNARVRVTLEEYNRVRGHGARFILCPGHEQPDVERVVEEHDGWVVAEKTGTGKTVAQELDPRS